METKLPPKFTYLSFRRLCAGADLGGGVDESHFSPEEFDPLPTQSDPLCTILRYPYLVTADPKSFLRAPLEPIYTNFEGGGGGGGERAPKKRNFLVKVFRKVPKNAFARLGKSI